MKSKIILWSFCLMVSSAFAGSSDSVKIHINVSSGNQTLPESSITIELKNEVLVLGNTDNSGNATISLYSKTAKKPLNIIVTHLGHKVNRMENLKFTDGEELNIILEPLSDAEIIALVEGVLAGKDASAVMSSIGKEQDDKNEKKAKPPKEEKTKEEKPEKEKKVKQPKEKKPKEEKPEKEKKEKSQKEKQPKEKKPKPEKEKKEKSKKDKKEDEEKE